MTDYGPLLSIAPPPGAAVSLTAYRLVFAKATFRADRINLVRSFFDVEMHQGSQIGELDWLTYYRTRPNSFPPVGFSCSARRIGNWQHKC